MKLVLQQVTHASVTINNKEKKEIGHGLVVYLAITQDDETTYEQKIQKFINLLQKMKFLSIGSDKIDKTIEDVEGSILVISNFTIGGRMEKGTRVDFGKSAPFAIAKDIYETCIAAIQNNGFKVQSGEFGAMMDITSTVHGPINYILEL